ncbi:hypothetical protein QJQ45_004968 [Haematococcus lacustris]|nr:hypothetical protein QJQ45_004968 [Haematococcus lacustris]
MLLDSPSKHQAAADQAPGELLSSCWGGSGAEGAQPAQLKRQGCAGGSGQLHLMPELHSRGPCLLFLVSATASSISTARQGVAVCQGPSDRAKAAWHGGGRRKGGPGGGSLTSTLPVDRGAEDASQCTSLRSWSTYSHSWPGLPAWFLHGCAGQVKHASGRNNARRDTERSLAPIKPHLQHLAAVSSAGTSLEANLKYITVTLATWDAVWEVYMDPKWARQQLRLYAAQDRALEQLFKELEKDMAEVSMERHGHAKQLVVLFGAASIGTRGGWGADAVLQACWPKAVCRPKGAGQRWGRVVLVTPPIETPLAPRKPPQAPRSSQEATPAAASEPGPSTPPLAKRSKRTKAEPAAEPTQPTKATKAKPAPQPGRWLDRDCNAALNMQRIGESRWRPLELCY